MRSKYEIRKTSDERRATIICAKSAGFCFGVERAIKLANQAAKKNRAKVYTLGPLIHNPQEVRRLEKKGIIPVSDLKKVGNNLVIIRSHGISPEGWEEIKKKKLKFIDTTCPFVLKAQKLAQKLQKEGYFVIVVGEKNHPEIKNIIGYTNGRAVAIGGVKDLKNIPSGERRIGVISQTTQTLETFIEVINELLLRYRELKIYNTICQATTERQKEAKAVAEKVGIMLVIGGRNSANTTHLAGICGDTGAKVYHIETDDEIKGDWVKNNDKIGITAGASTPDWIIRGVIKKLLSFRAAVGATRRVARNGRARHRLAPTEDL
ncbi:MAG: 4-hydroxy-3-methylbut-2-enyl diphosphate reductase [bacterium]